MTAYEFETILTLEARSNFFLEAISQRLDLTDQHIFNLIRLQFRATTEILTSKHIKYASLRRALVPSAEYHERALVFDYTRFTARLYGREVIHTVLPLLRREGYSQRARGRLDHSRSGTLR